MSDPIAIRPVGIVVALTVEAKVLTACAIKPGGITPLVGAAVCLSGMGLVAARKAARTLADAGAKALATFGVAGALESGLRNSTLFCPERVCDEQGHDYTPDPDWRAHILLRLAQTALLVQAHGSLLSVTLPLLTQAAKTNAHSLHMAAAADMESAAVAEIAKARGLPFIALRAIVDEASDTVPVALHESIDPWGRPRLFDLVATMCRHPTLLARLPRLYSRMRHATQALHIAADAAGPGLGWPP